MVDIGWVWGGYRVVVGGYVVVMGGYGVDIVWVCGGDGGYDTVAI